MLHHKHPWHRNEDAGRQQCAPEQFWRNAQAYYCRDEHGTSDDRKDTAGGVVNP
jgi:hypothetical protein